MKICPYYSKSQQTALKKSTKIQSNWNQPQAITEKPTSAFIHKLASLSLREKTKTIKIFAVIGTF